MNRRHFLLDSSLASAALMHGLPSGFAPEAELEVTVQPEGTTISRHLYGQFIEHLGGVIYDGVWVGRNSKIANVAGIRKRFIDDMKAINTPNFRWPGGCFADGYHWRDGIGAPGKRSRSYNYWQATTPPGVDATETNQFGIHEFMKLCRLTGAEPYLAANMASGSPQEFHDWVTYCNAPQGTGSLVAEERAANGDGSPFHVRYWGVGNESWGCGGDMTPQEYSTLYRRYATQFPAYLKPFLVAVGPRGHSKDLDLGWTDGFFASMKDHKTPVDGLSMHYYTDFRQRPEKVASFDYRGWYDVLREGMRTEDVIRQHWETMARYDPQHHTKLVLDEWGVWYQPGEEITPGYLLSQPLTLRDALHTAITFDIFNRHADKLEMANVAQTINCIHSLFLAKEDLFTRTPVYYVFAMYRAHMDASQAYIQLRCDKITAPSRGATAAIPALSASASTKARIVTVTVTNLSLDAAISTRIKLAKGDVAEGRGIVLTHPVMTATNGLNAPEQVTPAVLPVRVSGGRAEISIPAKAIVSLELRMA